MRSRTFTIGRSEATDLNIAGLINRHITDKHLTKIQVRHSSHSPAVSHQGIQERLRALAKRQPLPKIDFSCRPHDNSLTDASGETHVQLIYLSAPPQTRRLRDRLLALFQKPGAKPAARSINDNTIVIDEIRLILKNTLTSWKHHHKRQAVPICHVAAIAREERINQLLSPMDRNTLADWFKNEIEVSGYTVGARFSVSYQFRPYRSEQGTDVLGGGDIELELMDIPQEPAIGEDTPCEIPTPAKPMPERKEPSAMATRLPRRTLTVIDGTLPPDWVEDTQPYILAVRILQPASCLGQIEFQLRDLPARIDRDLLVVHGLDKQTSTASLVASNSTPLEIDVTPAGRLFLKAQARQGLGTPMYYLPSGRGIIGDVQLNTADARIIVNSPHGVRDPVHGHLDPIILQVTVKANAAFSSVEPSA